MVFGNLVHKVTLMRQIENLVLEESIRLERLIPKLWRHCFVVDQLD